MWCIQTTSATTYATAGALNKVVLSVLGVVVFGEVPTVRQGWFIALGLAGCFVYAYAKALQKVEKQRLQQQQQGELEQGNQQQQQQPEPGDKARASPKQGP